jgi:hypothetical protein
LNSTIQIIIPQYQTAWRAISAAAGGPHDARVDEATVAEALTVDAREVAQEERYVIQFLCSISMQVSGFKCQMRYQDSNVK